MQLSQGHEALRDLPEIRRQLLRVSGSGEGPLRLRYKRNSDPRPRLLTPIGARRAIHSSIILVQLLERQTLPAVNRAGHKGPTKGFRHEWKLRQGGRDGQRGCR